MCMVPKGAGCTNGSMGSYSKEPQFVACLGHGAFINMYTFTDGMMRMPLEEGL